MVYDSVELKKAVFAVLEDDAVKKLVFEKNDDSLFEVGLGVEAIPDGVFVNVSEVIDDSSGVSDAGTPNEVFRRVMEDNLPAGILARNMRFASTPDPAVFFGHNVGGMTGHDNTEPGMYIGFDSSSND